MRLLLDTHIWIWSILDPGRLARRIRKALDNPENELWLSPISIWEFLLLCERRRLLLDAPVEEWIATALKRAPVIEAPLTREVALATQSIRLPHRDPADRFLAATARVFQLTLVTGDERLIRAKPVPILANR